MLNSIKQNLIRGFIVLLHRMVEVLKVSKIGIDKAAMKGAQIIRKGGLVAFPTETVYGLGANALDEDSVTKIFDVKGRPPDNPLIVHVSSTEQLDLLWQEVPEVAYKLIETFWPGPLTIVLPKTEIVPYRVTGGLDTIAVRMPKNTIALRLIEYSEVPIAAPSANKSGRPSPTKAEDVVKDLGDSIDLVIDGGPTEVGVESTVLDLTKDPPTILRPGGLSLEEIKKVVPNVTLHPAVLNKFLGRPESPGMRYRHYAPEIPLILVSEKYLVEVINDVLKKYEKVGLITLSTPKYLPDVSNLVIRSFRNDIKAMARNLFSTLREFEEIDLDAIIAVAPPKEGIGLAIYNRLKKAATDIKE